MATVVAAATVVDAGLQGAAYRRTWVVLDERGETVTFTFSFPHAVGAAACYLAAAERERDAAEAHAEAAHQAARDRAREPDRWPGGRRTLPRHPRAPSTWRRTPTGRRTCESAPPASAPRTTSPT